MFCTSSRSSTDPGRFSERRQAPLDHYSQADTWTLNSRRHPRCGARPNPQSHLLAPGKPRLTQSSTASPCSTALRFSPPRLPSPPRSSPPTQHRQHRAHCCRPSHCGTTTRNCADVQQAKLLGWQHGHLFRERIQLGTACRC
jgi:hypothetical protein